MRIDELLLLDDAQIDYASLETPVLVDLALQPIEPFLATSALGELSVRRVPEAFEAALTLLAKDYADRFLKSFAIRTMFSQDPARAIAVLSRVGLGLTEPKIVDAMIDGVLGEPHLLREEPGSTFARRLQDLARNVIPDDTCDVEQWRLFLEQRID